MDSPAWFAAPDERGCASDGGPACDVLGCDVPAGKESAGGSFDDVVVPD
jgi:hypothetical protein